MARDIRDEIEGLFKAAAEDPSLGDAPKKRVSTKAGPPATPTSPPPQKKNTTLPPNASAPGGKPRAQTTLPPQPSTSPSTPLPTQPPPARKTNTNVGPPAASSNGTLPPGKKSASSITPELLRKTAGTNVTGASIPAVPVSPMATNSSAKAVPKDTPRPPPSQRSIPAAVKAPSTIAPPPAPPRSARGPGAAGSKKQMIEYSPDESLVDHRGRSKPMYKPRTPRPASWRPSKPIRLLLGLFPGARLMALETVSQGWPYTALGILALIPAIFLMLGWSSSAERVAKLAIDERWLLAHAGAIFALIGVFELLRLGAYFEERLPKPRVPRILAALTIPAILIVVGAPRLIPLWPHLIEAAWCAAVVLAIGGLAGSTWCLLEGSMESTGTQRTFRIVGIAIIVVLLVGGVLTGVFVPGTLAKLATWGRALGFQALPELLGH